MLNPVGLAQAVDFGGCGPSICTGASCVLGSTDRDPGVRYFSYGAIWSPSPNVSRNVSLESQSLRLKLPRGARGS